MFKKIIISFIVLTGCTAFAKGERKPDQITGNVNLVATNSNCYQELPVGDLVPGALERSKRMLKARAFLQKTLGEDQANVEIANELGIDKKSNITVACAKNFVHDQFSSVVWLSDEASWQRLEGALARALLNHTK